MKFSIFGSNNKIIFLVFLTIFLVFFWSSEVGLFSINLLLGLLFIFIILTIQHRFLRSGLLFFYMISAFLAIPIKLKYGFLSTSMVMASVGTGQRAILATIGTINFVSFLCFIALSVVFIYISFNSKNISLKLKYKFLMILLFLLVLSKPLVEGMSDWGERFYINNVKYDPTFISQPYLDQFPIFFGPIISAVSVKANDIVNNKIYTLIEHNSLPKYVKKEESNQNNIILIIGESSNPHRYGIYGYDKDTTPYLQKLEDNGKLYKSQNVHSPAAQTRLAVPMLVSFSTPKHKKQLFKYKNVLEMAKEQKYKTYWFDAQMQNNMWNKPFGFISKYADVRLVPDGNNTEFPINEGDDLKLLSYVKEYFSKPAEKNFYVIHLMGNHLPYSYNGGQDVSFLNDNYDKSIYGVNQIINSIYTYADKYLKDYTLIYVSDHGEVVNVGHGYPTKENEMYKIPLLTNRYEVSKEIDSMRDSHGYFSSSNLKYIIMELIGYQVKENKIKDAVANSDYVLDEQERIVKFSELIDIN